MDNVCLCVISTFVWFVLFFCVCEICTDVIKCPWFKSCACPCSARAEHQLQQGNEEP